MVIHFFDALADTRKIDVIMWRLLLNALRNPEIFGKTQHGEILSELQVLEATLACDPIVPVAIDIRFLLIFVLRE